MNKNIALVVLLVAYTAASLVHFAHNAIYLREYPNMPVWFTTAGVWFAWIGVASVGAAGCFALCRGLRLLGLMILAFYAVLGFGGLDHYVVAPVSAHTVVMNLTIALEAGTAMALLGYIAYLIVLDRRRRYAALEQ